MSELKATLADVGITQEEVASFLDDLVERNGGLNGEALMILYFKLATATEILRRGLEIEPVVVTLEGEE